MGPARIDLAGVRWILEESPHGGGMPRRSARGRSDPPFGQGSGHLEQADPRFQVKGENVRHHRRFPSIQGDPARITRTVRMGPIAVGRPRPRQQ
jgi:hypothetical protein